MRDKVLINDLRVLFICPSEKWGPLERRIVNDCLYLKKIGGKPLLYCIKDSYIDLQAQKHSLPRQFHKGKKVHTFFDLRYYLDLKSILKEYAIDVIHCYNLNYVWTLCLLLMTKAKYPLILTVNSHQPKNYDSLFQKWLLKRVDYVMTFSTSIKDAIKTKLPIPTKKIEVVGAGVATEQCPKFLKETIQKVGVIITDSDQLKFLPDFINTIEAIKSDKKIEKQSIQFVVYTYPKQITDTEVEKFNASFQTLNENKIEVIGVELDTSFKALENIDLYISLAFNQPFCDIEIMALLWGAPIIVPRMASRSELLDNFCAVGFSFKQNDSRELRQAIMSLVSNQKLYLGNVQQHRDGINILHGKKHYLETVYSHYTRICAQRMRFTSLKSKSN